MLLTEPHYSFPAKIFPLFCSLVLCFLFCFDLILCCCFTFKCFLEGDIARAEGRSEFVGGQGDERDQDA